MIQRLGVFTNNFPSLQWRNGTQLVYDKARTIEGRPHTDRWRHVVFVCMTPAKWAKQSDIKTKRTAYDHLLLTTQWPSRIASTFPMLHPTGKEGIQELTELQKRKLNY